MDYITCTLESKSGGFESGLSGQFKLFDFGDGLNFSKHQFFYMVVIIVKIK